VRSAIGSSRKARGCSRPLSEQETLEGRQAEGDDGADHHGEDQRDEQTGSGFLVGHMASVPLLKRYVVLSTQ